MPDLERKPKGPVSPLTPPADCDVLCYWNVEPGERCTLDRMLADAKTDEQKERILQNMPRCKRRQS